MLKFSKIFTCFVIFIVFFISPVFASNVSLNSAPNTTIENNTDYAPPDDYLASTTINNDLFVNNDDSYSLDKILYGNAFISTGTFSITSQNNGGIVFGDIFASTINTTIKSDLVYSNTKDKIGNYLVSDVKSSSVINGNVYILATDTFTLESKCEIHGDLYVYANNVNIAQDAVISGNVFVFANSTFNLNGKVSGSVYASSSKFTMNYTGYVSKDLVINTNDANISGKIDRNTKINSTSGTVATTSDFITAKDLKVEAIDFGFAGEVQGNAQISSKALTFDNSKTCIIRGNLDYATKSELTIPEGVVIGETKTSNYVDKNSFGYVVLEKLISYLTLLIYVFVVAFIFRRIAPNFIEKLSNINMTNTLIGLGVGFALFLALIPFLILFIFIKFTTPLAMLLLLSVLFISAIAMPLLVTSLANTWKNEKLKLDLKVFIITSILFVISLIPYFGPIAILLFELIAVGKILMELFKKK